MVKKKVTFFTMTLLGLLFLETGCETLSHSIPFITVREADLRHGPVDLPLSDAERQMILSFLQRGGNWGTQDVVDSNAPTHYSELLDLLCDPAFLSSHNFRNETKIDEISPTMKKWFFNPIIYQIIDATKKRPPTHNPMGMSDGKYWWIFYTEKSTTDPYESRITRMVITASLTKSMVHYKNIQEDAMRSPLRNRERGVLPEMHAERISQQIEHADFHTLFVQHLLRVSHVKLVSRLKDSRLGFPEPHDIRVFIPDVHLISREKEKTYKYGTNYVPLLSSLAEELIEFKKSGSEKGALVTVYQLGDFFDLWRETPVYLSRNRLAEGTATRVQKIAEDHQILYERLFGPELNTQHVLGNHDFDLHYLEDFIGSELRYYFPFHAESNPVALAVHGDIFDQKEGRLSAVLKHMAVYYLGPSVHSRVLNLTPIKELIVKNHGENEYTDYIHLPKPSSIGRSHPFEGAALLQKNALGDENHNVLRLGDPNLPEKDLKLFPQARDFAAQINDETGWNIRVVVCGHTHFARIVVDDRSQTLERPKGGFFALVDCGAWIEECSLDGEIVPNAQIGIMYNNDIRIYQLYPKK